MATRTSAASPKKASSKKTTSKTSATMAQDESVANEKATNEKATDEKAPAAKKTAKKAASKAKAKPAAAPKAKRRSSAKAGVATPAGAKRSSRKAAERTVFLPRAIASVDDDDPLMAHGGGGGGFGRCGGRALSNRLEQQLCQRLGIAGVVHSHSPRHYEIRYDSSGNGAENMIAAYAPMIVLRGRGREGKGVVIEAVEDAEAAILKKIVAFRAQYGQEFYVILVANDEVLDEVPLASYDESCSSTNVHTLIARLAE